MCVAAAGLGIVSTCRFGWGGRPRGARAYAQTFCDPLRCHCGSYSREKRGAVPLPPRRRSCIHLYVPNPLQGYSACRFRSHGRMSYRQLSQLNSEWDNSGENELLNRLNKVSAFAINLLFNTLYYSFRVLQYVIYFHMSNSKLSAHALKSKILYIINKKYRHLCKGMVQYNCQRER